MFDLAQRVAATQPVIDRYRTLPFSWRERRTCLHVARAQMRAMGHRPPSIPDVRTAVAAQRALRRAGHHDLTGLIDALGLERIAPLAMWPGDLALGPGCDGMFDGLGIWVGSGVFGYSEDHLDKGLVFLAEAMPGLTAAWRL